MTQARAARADPATFEIVKNSVYYKIAEEMRVVLRQDRLLADPRNRPATTPAACSTPRARWWRRGQTCRSTSAPCRVRGHGRDRGVDADVRARRRVHPQRPLLRRQPSARRQRGPPGLPRGAAARLRLPARALARRRLGHARQLRRRHRDLRRGPAPAAAAALRRRRRSIVDLEQIILANVRTPDERKRRPRRPAGGQPSRRDQRLSELARALRRASACWPSWRR